MKMLIKLKDQRNMTLKLNEQWINLQVNHIKRLDELKINQIIINTQEETIIKLQKMSESCLDDTINEDQSW